MITPQTPRSQPTIARMNKLTLILAIFLAACGGGSIEFDQPEVADCTMPSSQDRIGPRCSVLIVDDAGVEYAGTAVLSNNSSQAIQSRRTFSIHKNGARVAATEVVAVVPPGGTVTVRFSVFAEIQRTPGTQISEVSFYSANEAGESRIEDVKRYLYRSQ